MAAQKVFSSEIEKVLMMVDSKAVQMAYCWEYLTA